MGKKLILFVEGAAKDHFMLKKGFVLAVVMVSQKDLGSIVGKIVNYII